MNRTDARGYACPEPVLMTKNALKNSPEGIEVLVDNQTAAQNVTRFASNKNYQVKQEIVGEDYLLTFTK